MRIHILQHVPFETEAFIGEWAARKGHAVSRTLLYDPASPLPDADGFDWLVVMGGPMGTGDEAAHPWLAAEKSLIREAVEAGRRVLGICLGAQLIAAALGAKVRRNPAKEIGWFEVELTDAASRSAVFAGLPPHFPAFHWHGDTFDVPAGGIHTARSAACEAQAFDVGGRVIGLQFHLEATPESVHALCKHCADELAAGPFIQTTEEMNARPDRFARTNALMETILDAMESAGD